MFGGRSALSLTSNGKRARRAWLTTIIVIGLLLANQVAHADEPSNFKKAPGIDGALNALNSRAQVGGRDRAERRDANMVAENFEVLGHHDLGDIDSNGDVWVHGNFAYVGTWARPCTGRGVKIIDVSDLRRPRLIGTLASREGTSAEDMVVRRVATAGFTGDLLAVGIQRCSPDPRFDSQQYGVEFWDVNDPYHPSRLSFLGVTNGGGGVHELDLFQLGGKVHALLATPFSEWFDPVPGGDFRIIDATDPRNPRQVGQWGAGAHGLAPGPFSGQGSFGAAFDHSARVSADGARAYVSYWDLGVLTLDITDVTNPRLVSRTRYAPDADGDAHSVAEYRGKRGNFLLQNDEDFDPRSPARIRYGAHGMGIASESPGGTPLWFQRGHQITAAVVPSAHQGCDAADYPAATAGAIALVGTPLPFFDPAGGEEPLCAQAQQDEAAASAGAVAVVHDFISTATSPQWFDFGAVPIPVLFTDHATAEGMRAAGRATLHANTPSWGFLRVFDASTGEQVAEFSALPHVSELPVPTGDWSIHNTEVSGDRAYSSWYSHGIVALDLRPLDRPEPGNPRLVGQFVPPGAASHTPILHSGVAIVWGVAIRQSDGLIFASDMNGGLWIVKPTGPAASHSDGGQPGD
jgi:hypothetical protein